MTLSAFFPVGLGNPDYLHFPDPAAGANHSNPITTVPAGEIWLPTELVFKCIADANAANRRLEIEFDVGGTGAPFFRIINFDPLVANGSIQWTYALEYNIADNTGGVVGANDLMLGLPWVFLPAGSTIKFWLTNLQVGDQISRTHVQFLRFKI